MTRVKTMIDQKSLDVCVIELIPFANAKHANLPIKSFARVERLRLLEVQLPRGAWSGSGSSRA